MIRKSVVVEALRVQRLATLGRFAALDGADWQRRVLPGWAVRDVAAHLLTTDRASVTGGLLPALRAPDARERVERWNDRMVHELAGTPPEELLADLQRWGQRLQRLARALPAPLGRVPVRTAFGAQPLLFLLGLRVHDEWVHERDVALATGDGDVGPVAAEPPLVVGETLAATALLMLPRAALPRAGRSVGVVRLIVDPAPPGGAISARPVVWGLDFARRHFGPRVTDRPDAQIRTAASALALVIEHRVGWRDLAAPWLQVDGDADLAAAVLDALPLPRT